MQKFNYYLILLTYAAMTRDERKEYNRKYYQENAERIKEQKKQYYQNNAERIKEQNKQYYQNNAERLKEHQKQYDKQYNKTPMGRASYLLGRYNQNDKKYNRGKGDLTTKWIVENIFTKPCAHCGKKGWQVIGCNRLDNSLPHTMDNVEPCCKECNDRLPKKKETSQELT